MDSRIASVRSWVEEHDASLYRSAPFLVSEIRDSGNGVPGSYTIKGVASVFNQWSLDLGGFRERIMPGAFDRVLDENPHVLHTWDHDTARTLSSTRSKRYPLELRTSKEGLEFFSRVAPTTDAANLRILMEGEVVDQSSFAFTVREAEWRFLEDEDMLERDIHEVEGLFDVTTCAMGAYPQTDSQLAVRTLLRGTVAVTELQTFGMVGTGTTTNRGGSVWIPQRISVRSEEVQEGTPSPAPEVAPAEEDAGEAPEVAPAQEGTEEEAASTEAPAEQPEDREAREREFRLWQQKRAAEHRRTREFAFGVRPQEK